MNIPNSCQMICFCSRITFVKCALWFTFRNQKTNGGTLDPRPCDSCQVFVWTSTSAASREPCLHGGNLSATTWPLLVHVVLVQENQFDQTHQGVFTSDWTTESLDWQTQITLHKNVAIIMQLMQGSLGLLMKPVSTAKRNSRLCTGVLLLLGAVERLGPNANATVCSSALFAWAARFFASRPGKPSTTVTWNMGRVRVGLFWLVQSEELWVVCQAQISTLSARTVV